MPKQTNYWAKTATDEANLSTVLQSHDCQFKGVYKILMKDLRGLKEPVTKWMDKDLEKDADLQKIEQFCDFKKEASVKSVCL